MMLYELATDYVAFLQAVENGDIPDEAIEDTLEAIKTGFEEKVDNIACLIKGIEAECDAIRAEELRLAERRKAKERKAERCRSFLENMIQYTGIDKVETARCRITFRKSEAVEVDETFLEWAKQKRPDLLTVAQPTANKTEIKNAIKNGDEVVGVVIRVNHNMQLK